MFCPFWVLADLLFMQHFGKILVTPVTSFTLISPHWLAGRKTLSYLLLLVCNWIQHMTLTYGMVHA